MNPLIPKPSSPLLDPRTGLPSREWFLYWASLFGDGATGVESVTGLNTDNTDPQNPIVRISVDGVTVTGAGTPASPLVSTGSGFVPTSRTISTVAPLSGGGDLSANRTISTSMATNKLIGRGTAATGVMEEITLGTNLSLSGTTLNAAAGGPSIGSVVNFALMGATFNRVG